MKDKNNEIQVEDGEDIRGSGALGIKEIALEQYRRCCVEGSKEMTRGGISTKIVGGIAVKIEVPNQREIFMNAVKVMEVILAPQIQSRKKIKEGLKEYDKKVDEQQKKYSAKYHGIMTEVDRDASAPVRHRTKGNWGNTLQQVYDNYELELVALFRDKLIVLSELLNELNYFEEGSAVGG